MKDQRWFINVESNDFAVICKSYGEAEKCKTLDLF